MNLSDHLRPLLRDHDCVIIPDFGGLVAEYTSARVQPGGRHLLSPPTRQVAFNQALTRNDGLLVDALREHLGLPAAEAREALRQAVAALHHELQAQQHTELPGIGVFRQLSDRGLQFEYTGTDNLLAAAFGLPELTAHPVRATDARLAREQQAQLAPRLRAAGRGLRLRRLVPGGAIGLLAGLAVAGLYLLNLHPEAVPVAWQSHLPQWGHSLNAAAPQQAALVRPSFVSVAPAPVPTEAAPTEAPAATTGSAAATSAAKPVSASAPTQTAPQAPDPVEAMLRAPTPKRGKKVPAAAMAAVADESNVARPVPMARRLPGSEAAKMYVAPAAAARVATPSAPTTPTVARLDSKAVAVAPAAPKAPATVATPATAATIKARTGRYYVVVAAYSSLKGAEQGCRNLSHAGRPAKVILPPAGSRLYRLSAADFADRPAAVAAAARLRQNPHLDKGLTVFAY